MSKKRFRYIYCITNLVNGKNYFGQHTMRKGYKTELADMYWGSGMLLKRAQQKYGLENFKKEIIISGKFSKEQINRFEKCIIACQRLIGKAEYNIADGGEGWSEGMRKSHWISTHSESFKQKISSIRKAQESDVDWRKATTDKTRLTKIKNGTYRMAPMKGKKLTQEQIQRMKKSKRLNPPIGSKNGSFGKSWWTNGKENVKSEVCPDGFWKGRYLGGKPKIKKERKKVFYECIETGEILQRKQWIEERGFTDDLSTSVKKGCANKGFHFRKVENIKVN